MKNNTLYAWTLMLAMTLGACDENDVMPAHQTLGTATHTMANISASTEEPLPSESVSLSISYVNPSVDPLKEISVRAKVGEADYVEIEKVDVTSEAQDEMLEKTIEYVAPATSGTTVVFDMVITSQKQFPQIKRIEIITK